MGSLNTRYKVEKLGLVLLKTGPYFTIAIKEKHCYRYLLTFFKEGDATQIMEQCDRIYTWQNIGANYERQVSGLSVLSSAVSIICPNNWR